MPVTRRRFIGGSAIAAATSGAACQKPAPALPVPRRTAATVE
ncbi:MAG: twin-arginine translocation signal domain-containing protein, partial [Myxococcales bacterium]|nr:twin-arginine translocation signal domain-containing protein [Myxococcales bacterium]